MGSDPIQAYTPSHAHVFVYQKARDSQLFPNNGKNAGFHLRRGGYPVMFIPLREEAPGYFKLQPFVIGHELGEVSISHMLRGEDGCMGLYSHMDHPLKEGFCELIGLQYYTFFARQQKNTSTFQ